MEAALGPKPEGDYLPTTNGEWVAAADVGSAPAAALDEGSVVATAGAGRKWFYLTKTNYPTNAVMGACAAGFHMASLWEILDVSNLWYARGQPNAYQKADSGFGPPSYWHGWVHTGYDSSASSVTGTGNCDRWSTTSASAYGVSVRLSRTWETAPGDIFVWDANKFSCNYTGPVWCMQN